MLMRLINRRRKGFLASKTGIATTEFAMILPVMLLMLLGGFELMRAVAASTRSTYLANNLAELLSQTTTTLTEAEAKRIIESAALINPDLLEYARASGRIDVWNVAEIALSSVEFKLDKPACKVNCDYRGDLVFSYAETGPERPCGRILPASSATTALDKLPEEVFGPGSVIVVDVKVPYRPIVGTIFDGEFDFERTAYLRPRYSDRVNYTTNCAGF